MIGIMTFKLHPGLEDTSLSCWCTLRWIICSRLYRPSSSLRCLSADEHLRQFSAGRRFSGDRKPDTMPSPAKSWMARRRCGQPASWYLSMRSLAWESPFGRKRSTSYLLSPDALRASSRRFHSACTGRRLQRQGRTQHSSAVSLKRSWQPSSERPVGGQSTAVGGEYVPDATISVFSNDGWWRAFWTRFMLHPVAFLSAIILMIVVLLSTQKRAGRTSW